MEWLLQLPWYKFWFWCPNIYTDRVDTLYSCFILILSKFIVVPLIWIGLADTELWE